MRFPLFNRALLPGILAGPVVLASTACSRADRTESGSNDSSTVLQDSNSSTVQPSAGDTAAGTMSDTAAISADSGRSAAPKTPVKSNSPRAETAAPSESDAAGYRAMDRASPDSTEIVRVRPPEDSTEVLGNVATTDDLADETADEQIVNPDDQEKVAASEAPNDEVGAAAVASGVTGAEAVALMSRGGVRCTVVDPETNEAVRWDMSSTPVTLNPCGMGSMVLSSIWTRVE